MHHWHLNRYVRDQECLRAIQTGGPGAAPAIGFLYKKYRRRILAGVTRLVNQHPVFRGHAEDLLHDAFLLMLHKIETGHLEVHSLYGLWAGIAKKLFLNQLKKDERFEIVYEPETGYGIDEISPEAVLLEQEEQEEMEHVFAQLGPRCREVLVLWAHRFTMSEIAMRLHLTNEAMARKIKYQCFKKLKEFVRTGHKWPRERH